MRQKGRRYRSEATGRANGRTTVTGGPPALRAAWLLSERVEHRVRHPAEVERGGVVTLGDRLGRAVVNVSVTDWVAPLAGTVHRRGRDREQRSCP